MVLIKKKNTKRSKIKPHLTPFPYPPERTTMPLKCTEEKNRDIFAFVALPSVPGTSKCQGAGQRPIKPP